MKKTILSCVCCLFFVASFAKGKDKMRLRLDSINHFLAVYDTLNPWNSREGVSEEIDSIQSEIINRLYAVLTDPAVVKYPIENILKEPLGINCSSDHRLYIFCLDRKTGGSYDPATVIIHYRLKNGKVGASILPDNENEENSSFYGSIYTLDSSSSTYLTFSSVKGCNTCDLEAIETITLDTSAYTMESVFDYSTRFSEKNYLDYTDSTKTIHYQYEYYDDDYMGDGYGDDPQIENCTWYHLKSGTLQYTNGSFLQIESSDSRRLIHLDQ